jgi:hypothetical protein
MTALVGIDAYVEEDLGALGFNIGNEPASTGDIRITSSGEFEFYIDGEGWIGVKEFNETSSITCLYCGSGWHENRFHPGTCDNCGAPEDLGKSDGHE